LALCAALGLTLAASPVAAQRSPPGSQSDVIVNYGVLDELGPAPTVPQVLTPVPGGFSEPPPGAYRSPVLRNQRATSGERIHLHPPKATSKRAKRSGKARHKASAHANPNKARSNKAKAKASAKAKPAKSRTAAREAAPPVPSAAPPPPPPVPTPPAAPSTATHPSALGPMPPVPPSAPPSAPRNAPPPPPPAAAVTPPATPPAAPAKAAPSTPAPAKTASLPPAPREPATTGSVRVLFDGGSARLSADGTNALKKVAQSLAGDDKLRIQLLAYAGGSDETASQARRLSLSRALAARSYLIGEGVRSTRIDVRALGNKSEGGPADRIDIVVTRR
jgi:outer membrane protein OmpA-like peptidoglycan-associated protein